MKIRSEALDKYVMKKLMLLGIIKKEKANRSLKQFVSKLQFRPNIRMKPF